MGRRIFTSQRRKPSSNIIGIAIAWTF